ncbi:MAG: lipocalin-like domain-containing protein [Elusimicrobiaceae bacterium]|nr:lipocalin-like domain-containing protein [Elusimicrobiaceae bacterium]MBT3955398.1 lipocalin-like domain-containing protein [Elusimicrobiaceae bacterium]MBT4007675.1 lipocalin-like domain-containing protein [Elusimicrobiaceae bacterium]MBT4402315.1 lipocalin-like domain-containing protein [Elusimicrobiaceae bacterium]MBT4439548.1 lipocalin-like domain-containing protein [Elusimicrobiaceae bacterium]
MKNNLLIGTWKLEYWKNIDSKGVEYYPFGKNASGYISYNSDNYMSVVISKDDRIEFKENDLFKGTIEEKASGYESYISYAGFYEIKGEVVYHKITHSIFPNWVGSAQERIFDVDKNTLLLKTKLFTINGDTQTAYLKWNKI